MKPMKKARLRQGGYSALITLLFLLAVVAVNLLADAAGERWALRLDLTENSVTALTGESVSAVSAIDQDAVIYLLFRSGENSRLRSTLEALSERYHALNPRIGVRVVDPVAQPGLVNKLKGSEATVSEGSVIVANVDLSRVKVIPSSDLYTYAYDESTGSYSVASFDGEAGLTSALLYVTSFNAPRALFLTGHNELRRDYCAVLTAQLGRENYEVRSFELGGTEKLQPGDALIVITPSLDLTQSELDELQAFLSGGGRLLYVNDPSIDLSKLPNFAKLLAEAGLGFRSGVVVEDQAATGNYLSGQLYLVPNADEQHEITAPIAGTRLILPGACAVTARSTGDYSVQALLTSSTLAYLKPTDYEGSLSSPLDTDERGPFTLAAASEREGADGAITRIVAVGNLYVAADSDYMVSSGNLSFAVGAIKWLSGQQAGIQIRSKALTSDALQIPDARTLWLLAMLVVALIPGAVLVAGTIMYLRRRRL